MKAYTVVYALIVVVAGCVAPEPADEAPSVEEQGSVAASLPAAAAAPPAPSPPGLRTSTAFAACAYCYEPTVAVDGDGRVFVTTGRSAEGIAVSADGGVTWDHVDAPPLPEGAPPTAFRGDPTVQIDLDGRLVYHALLLEYAAVAMSSVVTLDGFQVAASEDGGKTWAWNTLVAPSTTRDATAEGDRQWLAFGPDDAVYMTQNQYVAFARPGASLPVSVFPAVGTGLRVARSTDDGRTFGAFQEIVARPPDGGTIGGQPIVDAEGRLLVPYFVYGGPSGLFVAISTDGGASFAHHAVHAPDGFPGAMFPSLAASDDGRLHMAWWTGDDVLFAMSEDGGKTWTEPAPIGSGAAVNSPWLVAGPAGVEALWSEKDGDDASTAWLLREGGRVALGRSAGFEGREAYTDFLHAARTPDGGVVAVLVGEAGESGRVDVVFAPAP